MRKRSLSVACDRASQLDKISKKFEGVPSEHENESETEEENDEVQEHAESDWTETDYKMLMKQLRSVLPRKDTKKFQSTLNKIDWERVAFDGRSSEEVKAVTENFMRKIRKHRTLGEMIEDIPLHTGKHCSIGKPKNPLSAYNFFMKDRFSYIRNKNPELSSGEVFKSMHQEYVALSEKKKRKYEAMAAEAKEVYNQQMEQYYQDNPQASKKTRKTSTSTSKSKSKVITPFNLFQKDKRNGNEQITSAEIRKQWNALEVNKKLKYVQQAFKSQTENTANPLKLTKEEQFLIERAKGKPAPIPRSTSDYYLKTFAETMPKSVSLAAWRKEKLLEFKNLPKVRKLELEIEYRQAKQEYVVNYERYIESITDEEQQQAEIDLLKSIIEKKMDRDDRQLLPGESRSMMMQTSQLENEMLELPIAESTILKTKTKKSKNAATQKGSDAYSSKQITPKSILKSPSKATAVTKKDGQSFVEPAVPTKNKRKHSMNDNDSDSNSEKKSKGSIVRVPIVEPNMKKKKSKENGTTAATAVDTNNELVRPPSNIIEYYKKYHYVGKDENCEESFKNLSTNRKETMLHEMRTAQQKYFKQLQKFLKAVPPQNIKKHIKKLKQAQTDFGMGDVSIGLTDSFNECMAKKIPKQEPETSGSSSSGSGSSGESSEDEKTKNGQNSDTEDDQNNSSDSE